MAVTVASGAAPVKPVINGITDDHGVPIVGPTSDPHPTMSGTVTPGDKITMYDGATPIGSVIICGDGKWTVQPEKDLGSGTHDIYVLKTSPSGVPSTRVRIPSCWFSKACRSRCITKQVV